MQLSSSTKSSSKITLPEEPSGSLIISIEKECLTWSKLTHPHIVQFLGVHFVSGSRVPMLILEKMDTNLRHHLEDHTKENFVLPDKIYVLRQVAQALCYLHSHSPPLVHHDLSPNNVLLNEVSLQAKVTDFGMTRAMDPSKMSCKSSMKGTQAFMSPEALVDPPNYDEKLDVFSYGNVIITTVTHKWPNPGPSTKAEGGKIIGFSEIQRREQCLLFFTPTESEMFLTIVCDCLENLPKDRPTSIQLVTQMKEIEASHSRKTAEPPITARAIQELIAREKAFKQEKERFQQEAADLRWEVDQLHLRLHAQQTEIDKLKKPSSPAIEVWFVYMYLYFDLCEHYI